MFYPLRSLFYPLRSLDVLTSVAFDLLITEELPCVIRNVRLSLVRRHWCECFGCRIW